MPNFYAKMVLNATDAQLTCVGKYVDKYIQPLAEKAGFCKNISSYNFKNDTDGNPLSSECAKISK